MEEENGVVSADVQKGNSGESVFTLYSLSSFDILTTEEDEQQETKYLTAFDGKSPKIPTDLVKEYLSTLSITNENWQEYLEVVPGEMDNTYDLALKTEVIDTCFSYQVVSANVECKVVKEGAGINGNTITYSSEYLPTCLVQSYDNHENLVYTIDDFEFTDVQIELIVANFPEELWSTSENGTSLVYTGADWREQEIYRGNYRGLSDYMEE